MPEYVNQVRCAPPWGSIFAPYGLSIDPLPTGNLGIDFPPSRHFVSGTFASATFGPDWRFRFSTSMGIRLIESNGGNNVMALQGVVAIQGCLLSLEAGSVCRLVIGRGTRV